jgi:hypothetical protein
MNLIRFGSPLASGYSDQPEGIRFHLPFDGIAGFLFAPGKSILLFSPPVLLGLIAWPRFFRRHRRLALGLLLGGGVFFLFEASWQNWGGGWCWGPRHIYQLTALLMIPAGALFVPGGVRWTLGRKILLGILLALGFAIQLIGISVDFIKAIHHLSTVGRTLTLFHPTYSQILLHLRMLTHGDHDLFVLWFLRSTSPGWWSLPALVFVLYGTAVVLLLKALQDAERDVVR